MGVVSGRWVAAWEGVEFGQGGRGGNNNGLRGGRWLPLLRLALCRGSNGRNHMVGKKIFFPGRVGKNPGEVGKKEIFFRGQLMGAL